MPKRKNGVPEKPASTEDDLREVYAKFKKEFSAADLQKYTEIEETIPAEQVIAACEAILRQESMKRKKA